VILIGIDPGVHTGFASWDATEGKFRDVLSLSIHRAMERVKDQAVFTAQSMLVIFEDARMRTWFGSADERQRKYGAAIREGVGSVKRDCSIWEEFLQDFDIPYQANKPITHGTKWTPEYFKRTTGWQGRTSEHARDAGVLVFGINEPMAQGMRRSWEQARTNAKAPAHTSAHR
jgi:hypothetical protein